MLLSPLGARAGLQAALSCAALRQLSRKTAHTGSPSLRVPRHRCAVLVVSGKRKGSSRPAAPTQQRKKTASQDAAQPAAPPLPPPLRITPGTLRGPGAGLKAVKRRVVVKKAWEANDWKPPKKVLPINQTYRRCLDREEFLEKRAAEEAEGERIRKRKGQSASYGMLYGQKGTSNPPVLIVDGYNVLWDIAKAERRAEMGGTSSSGTDSDDCDTDTLHVYDGNARESLERRLVEYSCARQVKVILVFDAMGGNHRSNVRSTNAGEIDVVYCGETEADNWILGEANRLVRCGAKHVLVATDDCEIKDSIQGAFMVSAVSLVREIKKVEQLWAQEEKVRLREMATTRCGIAAGLNPELLKILNDMR